MGFQIPGPTTGKVQYLMDMYEAVVLDRPPRNFAEIPDHQAIICVVDTIQYEVASYAFSRQEFSLLVRTRAPPRARGDREAPLDRGRVAGDAEPEPYRPGHG